MLTIPLRKINKADAAVAYWRHHAMKFFRKRLTLWKSLHYASCIKSPGVFFESVSNKKTDALPGRRLDFLSLAGFYCYKGS
ncbi:hypothetical protein BTJ39_02620 [Izhakiella australiensis]|uniref:Uncharacterized protein n=1 Tax=Izhakiella australiensis TaxID=1926881 RepID=A0A1S8YTA2_9GAMM|nr:hypothetical protein BTJ39_02620 [Izhakiella australiensis]